MGEAAAVAICETAERLTAEEGEPALRLYLLVVGALRSLADAEHEPSLILEQRLLADYLMRIASFLTDAGNDGALVVSEVDGELHELVGVRDLGSGENGSDANVELIQN